MFEVDHPDTQAAKRAALSGAGTETWCVVFVPVDFETDDLADALAQAGYVADRPTLFVWEGVSQYLSAAGVDSVLAVIRKVARAGGRLVLTYVDRSVIDGHSPEFPEAAKWLRGVNKRSEPWIFGISPAKISDFLTAGGFRLIEDVSTAEAGTRYFTSLGRRERGSGLYRVATAMIDPTPKG